MSETRSAWGEMRGYPTRAFWICLIGLTLANMDQAFFAQAMPEIRKEWDIPITAFGWFYAISFSVAAVLITIFGVVTDRVGRKVVMQTSIVVSSIFVTLHAVANSLGMLGVLRTLGFAAGGVQTPVTGTIVVEETPARLRGVMSGMLQTGYPFGWAFAFLISAYVLPRYGWRALFLVGLLSVPYIFVVGRFLRETDRFRQAREERAAASGAAAEPAKLRHLFAPDLRRTTIVIFLGEFLHVAAYGGSAFYFPTYFVEERGLELQTANLLLSAAYFIGAFGYVLSSFVGEFLLTRRNTIVLWSWLGTGMFLLLIWRTSSIPSVIVVFGLVTMFFYGTTAVKFTFLAEHFPTRVRATGISFSGAFAVNLGLALGPLAVAYMIESLGWNVAFSLGVAVPLFFSGLVFLLLPARASGLEVEEIAT